jgi:hypothetical protein
VTRDRGRKTLLPDFSRFAPGSRRWQPWQRPSPLFFYVNDLRRRKAFGGSSCVDDLLFDLIKNTRVAKKGISTKDNKRELTHTKHTQPMLISHPGCYFTPWAPPRTPCWEKWRGHSHLAQPSPSGSAHSMWIHPGRQWLLPPLQREGGGGNGGGRRVHRQGQRRSTRN